MVDIYKTIRQGLEKSEKSQKQNYLDKYILEEISGLLLWKSDYWVVIPQQCQMEIIAELHDTKGSRHPGVKKTLAMVARTCYWPNMKQLVEKYVRTCETCAWVKANNQKPMGLLQPLPIPEERWSDITMDFITGLPSSGLAKYNAALTIVDCLTRRVYFWPTHTTASAEDIAKLMVERYLLLHGIPQSIVSDRDPRFLSGFWCSFFGILGTKLQPSTAFHPQTDGLTERLNRILEDYLRCYLQESSEWVTLLSVTELVYNSQKQDSLGQAPFEVDLGYIPKNVKDHAILTMKNSNAEKLLDVLEANRRAAIDALREAQIRQKRQSDKHRCDEELNVGEEVYLDVRNFKVIPEAAQGLQPRKLQHRFIGPYKILKKIGMVAYELELPTTSKIHSVFHVSLLRKKIPMDKEVNRK